MLLEKFYRLLAIGGFRYYPHIFFRIDNGANAHAGDHDALERAINAGGPGRPHAVVALVEA